MKKATSIEQQIEILRERKMVLDLDESKIKEILLDVGYYRLGFFWHPFEIDKQHNFNEKTKFTDIVNLYYLDIDLKVVLLKILNRIEIHFRTQIIYYLSNKHPNNPIWFVDKKVMIESFVKDFDTVYNEKFIRNNKQIKKHHQKYTNDKFAPAWKTIEFLSFGSVEKLYKSIKDESSKKIIANVYGIKKIDVFENYLNTAVFVRNLCAHSGCLFDSNTPKEIKITPLIKLNNFENNRHSLDSQIKVLLYLINQISSNRKFEFEKEIDNLFEKYKTESALFTIIKDKIGYQFK